MSTESVCDMCRHWGAYGTLENGDIVGACQRNPPQIVSAAYDYKGRDRVDIPALYRATEWPVTLWTDRCGEFSPRNGNPSRAGSYDDLTTSEAATHVGLAEGTLANMRVRGDGPPFFRLGRLIRYDRGQLEAWARSQPSASTSEYRQ